MPTARDEDDRRLLASIEKHGWHSIAIEEDDEGPAFAYTIGVGKTWSQPEMIVIGEAPKLSYDILLSIVDAIKAGHRFEHASESEEVLLGYPVAFVSVDRELYREYLGWACWFHEGDDFPVLQCVLPDRAGFFPWEEGCRPSAIRRQPILNAEFAARVPAPGPNWPFDVPKDRAVFTTGQVIEQGLPILEVTRDHEDDWIFLTRPSTGTEDGKVVALRSVYELDPSVAEVADLRLGWWAWREAVGEPWQREELPEDEDEDQE